MVTWETWQQDRSTVEWDSLLDAAADAHPLQSYFWGEYRRMSGWEPRRYVARSKGGAVAGMAQVLVRNYFGVRLVWTVGTVAMEFPGTAWHGLRQEMIESLVGKLKSERKRTYVRFNFLVPHDHEFSYELGHFCVRPMVRLSGGYSVVIDLEHDQQELTRRLSSKHRYYVKKSLKEDIVWRSGNDPQLAAHLAALLHEIVANKQVSAIYSSREQIETLCQLGGQRVFMLAGYLDNQPITACLVIIMGDRAFYQIAATGERGRELSAAYAMTWHLLQLLRAQGVRYFDFGGLNPRDKHASGVSHFKRGFGGAIVEYLGEWECASSELLRLGVNLGTWVRGGRL